MSYWHPKMGLSSRMWAEEILWSAETFLASLSGEYRTVREVWETATLEAFHCAFGRYEVHRCHTFSFAVLLPQRGTYIKAEL